MDAWFMARYVCTTRRCWTAKKYVDYRKAGSLARREMLWPGQAG